MLADVAASVGLDRVRAVDAGGEVLAEARVAPSFKLTRASASAWAESGFSVQAVRG